MFDSKEHTWTWNGIKNDQIWIDGFIAGIHTVAVIDDFRNNPKTFDDFLRLIDRYPSQQPIKGSHAWFNPKYIIITCPRTPTYEFVRHQKDLNGKANNEVYEDVG